MTENNKRKQSPHYIPELDPENPDRTGGNGDSDLSMFFWVIYPLVTIFVSLGFVSAKQFVDGAILFIFGIAMMVGLYVFSVRKKKGGAQTSSQRLMAASLVSGGLLIFGAVTAVIFGWSHGAIIMTAMAVMVLAPYLFILSLPVPG